MAINPIHSFVLVATTIINTLIIRSNYFLHLTINSHSQRTKLTTAIITSHIITSHIVFTTITIEASLHILIH